MAGILPTSWSGPNRTLPATFQLSPEQTAKILQMHRESHSNALTYVFIVLVLYVFALGIMLMRYLRSEDPHALYRVASTLRRCLCRRRTPLNGGSQSSDADGTANLAGEPTMSPTQQTLTLVPNANASPGVSRSPIVTVTLREVQDTMV